MQAARKLEKASILRLHIEKRKVHGSLAVVVRDRRNKQWQGEKSIPGGSGQGFKGLKYQRVHNL
jgi:hypothetical protein